MIRSTRTHDVVITVVARAASKSVVVHHKGRACCSNETIADFSIQMRVEWVVEAANVISLIKITAVYWGID